MPFSQRTLDFLFHNRVQDSREWFHEHHDEYEAAVIAPMRELVIALTPDMLKIDPQFITEPKVDRTISRIHRDLRFSKDKSKYRDHCWLIFIRDKKLYRGLPGFFFEITPVNFSYGMGYYQAAPEAMAILREMVLNREPAFQKAQQALEGQQVFKLEGAQYKRSKYPDHPEALRMWLDKKSLSLVTGSDDRRLLFSEGLVQTLRRDFQLLVPIYEFLLTVEGRRVREDVQMGR